MLVSPVVHLGATAFSHDNILEAGMTQTDEYDVGDVVRATFRSKATGEYTVQGQVWSPHAGTMGPMRVGEQAIGMAVKVEVIATNIPPCPFALSEMVWYVGRGDGPFVVTGWKRWNGVWQVQYTTAKIARDGRAGGGLTAPENLTTTPPMPFPMGSMVWSVKRDWARGYEVVAWEKKPHWAVGGDVWQIGVLSDHGETVYYRPELLEAYVPPLPPEPTEWRSIVSDREGVAWQRGKTGMWSASDRVSFTWEGLIKARGEVTILRVGKGQQ